MQSSSSHASQFHNDKTKLPDRIFTLSWGSLAGRHHNGHEDMGNFPSYWVQLSLTLCMLLCEPGCNHTHLKGHRIIFLCLWHFSINHSRQCMEQLCIIWGLCWGPDIILSTYHLTGLATSLLWETSVNCEYRNIVNWNSYIFSPEAHFNNTCKYLDIL